MSNIKFMDVRVINPFITSIISLFQSVASLNMQKGALIKGQGRRLFSGYGVNIGVEGQIRGQVLYEFPDIFAVSLTELMTERRRGEYNSQLEFEDMVRSVVNEIGNQVSGMAITKLSTDNIDCDITPPVLYYGKEIQVIPKNLETLMIPFQSNIGFFSVNIAMDE